MNELRFNFDNSYARELEGFYVPWQGDSAPEPVVRCLNTPLAEELGLDADALATPEGTAALSGGHAPAGSDPLAQVYAGHQFGGFSEQLGDGRAMLLGEVLDQNGNRRDIHLKGSGRTPFSRGGDGKAVLGPVLREYLLGEAMHALGIPTTRALAAITTGESVQREGMQQGAVLARVAASHLRVGTFQFFAARGDREKVKQLADYAIARHFPEVAEAENPYLDFLKAVSAKQAALVAQWLHVGFVHGVMNTDNMTISGETIDYGPCAFVDTYEPKAVFSSIDAGGRYAFGNQPVIAQWNLARFAECLLPLIDPDDPENATRLATNEITAFPALYAGYWQAGMRRKIGLFEEREGDAELVNAMYAAMEGQGVDHTLFFRALGEAVVGDDDSFLGLFDDPTAIKSWLTDWRARLNAEPLDAALRQSAMDAVNPVYVPRNHLVEEALAAANDGDFAPFEQLLDVLSDPFTGRAGFEKFALPAPDTFGPYETFCGT